MPAAVKVAVEAALESEAEVSTRASAATLPEAASASGSAEGCPPARSSAPSGGDRAPDNLDRLLGVYVKRPHACCLGGCCTLFMLTVLAVLTGSMNMTLDQESAWSVHSGEYTAAWNAIKVAREDVLAEAAAEAQGRGSRRLHTAGGGALEAPEGTPGYLKAASRALAGWGLGGQASGRRLQADEDGDGLERLSLFYKVGAGGEIFTPAHLREMCLFERTLFESGVCDRECQQRAWSPVLTFYGGVNATEGCPELPQASVDSTLADMRLSVSVNGSNSRYAALVHPEFEARGSCSLTRASYKLRDAEDVVFDQMFQQFDPPLAYGFLRSAYQADADRFAKLSATSGPLRVRVFFDNDEFSRMIGPDFALAMGSFLFVYLCMWAYLGSCFMASVGMFQIFASLPVAGIIYRQIFMVDYFEFLHILVVYLVLGIGADDIFVFVDSWRHITSDPRFANDVLGALRATWLRTLGAVFNTSFTTAVAFLSMSISKVMPMRTCGWYAALCIMTNYVFVVTFTPAVLMVYQLRFQGKRCCCPSPSLQAGAPALTGGKSRFSALVDRFLHRAYLPSMQHKVGSVRPVPLVLVIIMLGVGIQGAYFSSQLTPPSKVEEWFPDNHMWTNFTEFTIANSYQPSYNTFDEMLFVWGIEGMDFSQFNPYRPDDSPGQPRFDGAFDITTGEAQQGILDVCRRLRELPCSVPGCKNAGTGKLALHQGALVGVSCFLEDMQEWYGAANGGGSLPTGPAFLAALRRFREEASPAELGADSHGELVEADYREDIGFVGGQLRYVAVRLRSSLPVFEPYGTGVAVRDLVGDFTEEVRRSAPASLGSFKVASAKLADFDLGAELISGLFSGCAIAGPISFLVILLSTQNALLALYAVTSVGFIVTGVLGFCKSAMGWDLGIAEAVAGVIVIGYSIDYVVHLAHIYCEADHFGFKTRSERASFAITNMGSTVFAGAITTAGSGSFMFLCFLMFFFKMALLICVTIWYSFLFSLCFFMGLLFIAGPEYGCGDIKCWQYLCLKRQAGGEKRAPDAAKGCDGEEDAEGKEGIFEQEV